MRLAIFEPHQLGQFPVQSTKRTHPAMMLFDPNRNNFAAVSAALPLADDGLIEELLRRFEKPRPGLPPIRC